MYTVKRGLGASNNYFYLIALARIQTQNFWLWYHIELHAPINLIQKLKLMGRSEQITYTSTIMLIFITSQFDRIKMMMIGSRGISSVEEQCHLQTYFSTFR